MASSTRVACARRRRLRRAGFTLIEVLAALGLVASVGVVSTAAGHALAVLGRAARAEAAGLAAAEAKVEEILSLRADRRAGGSDAITEAGIDVARVWRVRGDDPAPGLTRVEVTARWSAPELTLLTLVAVAP